MPKKKKFFNLLKPYREIYKDKEFVKYLKEKKKFDKLTKNSRLKQQQIYQEKRLFIIKRFKLAKKLEYYKWNYIATFTYNDKLRTEKSFKKKMEKELKKLERKKWVYIGVWEKSSTTKRLHFHAILYIPENAMVGEICKRKDFNKKSQRVKTIYLNTFFEHKFGRNDFSPLFGNEKKFNIAKDYITKHIENSCNAVISSSELDLQFERMTSGLVINDTLRKYCTNSNRQKETFFTHCKEGFTIGEFALEEKPEEWQNEAIYLSPFAERKRNSLAVKGNTKKTIRT